MNVDVLLHPAELPLLRGKDLTQVTCVVFDVLRATSSMVTALAHGAAAVVPVSEIEGALSRQDHDPALLLAGEREGHRIGPELTGGTARFAYGNSPREFDQTVAGRTLVMTTTNGTRALQACVGARAIYAAAFLNLSATARAIAHAQELLLVCSGTGNDASWEDALGAGALCHLLLAANPETQVSDAARLVLTAYRAHAQDIEGAMGLARNGQRLLRLADYAADVAFCAALDRFPIVAQMEDGMVRRVTEGN